MLIFRRGHIHIKQDDLSEYLDGRLSGIAASRIDRRLAECAGCREELESLRSTVSLLQRMPELTLPRSFVMPGPPPAPATARPPAPLRMPQWVYSGAAATAALVLAVLISADATGLLATDRLADALESVSAVQSAPERLQRDGEDAAIEMAAPLAPVVEEAVSVEKSLSVTVTQESEGPEAKAAAPALRKTAVQPQTAEESGAQGDSKTAPPVAAMAAAAVEQAVESTSTPPPPVAALAAAAAEAEATVETRSAPPTPAVDMSATKAEEPAETGSSPAEVIALAAPEMPPESALQPPSEGRTSTFWRVMEGLAALVTLGFLGSWLLRRRSIR